MLSSKGNQHSRLGVGIVVIIASAFPLVQRSSGGHGQAQHVEVCDRRILAGETVHDKESTFDTSDGTSGIVEPGSPAQLLATVLGARHLSQAGATRPLVAVEVVSAALSRVGVGVGVGVGGA